MKSNMVESVRARLTNHAKATGRPFQEVLQHYGLERFLYRLSQSPDRANFVLKGGLLLRVWGAPHSRPTRDIDLLASWPTTWKSSLTDCALFAEKSILTAYISTRKASQRQESRKTPSTRVFA